MENSTIEMELNNEEVMKDDVIENVVDTEIDDTDAEIKTDIEPKDEENSFAALFGVIALGAAAVGLMAFATRKEREKRRYEKLKRKMEKEAAKHGEVMSIAKLESAYDDIEESEDVESEGEFEN